MQNEPSPRLVKQGGVFPLLRLYTVLFVVGTLSLSWNLVAMFLFLLLPRQVGARLGRAAIAWVYRAGWAAGQQTGILKTDLTALDALRDERGLIVVANHPSMLDAMMLVSRLPLSACVMKAKLMKNPFLGPGARLAGYMPNDLPRAMIRTAVADLKQGGQLVLFPEGTRTVGGGGTLNSLLPGFTLIAKMAQAPIQTVLIDTASPYLTKGWPLWRLPPLPIVFSVRLGQRFAPSDEPTTQLKLIETYFRDKLARTDLRDDA